MTETTPDLAKVIEIPQFIQVTQDPDTKWEVVPSNDRPDTKKQRPNDNHVSFDFKTLGDNRLVIDPTEISTFRGVISKLSLNRFKETRNGNEPVYLKSTITDPETNESMEVNTSIILDDMNISPLGSGGSSEIRLGYDSNLDRFVALKRIIRGQDSDILIEEAKQQARQRSKGNPNVPEVYQVIHNDSGDYIVMEYLDREYWKETNEVQKETNMSIPNKKLLKILEKLPEALAKSNESDMEYIERMKNDKRTLQRLLSGILDIKPSNILVDPHGNIMIIDHGLMAQARVTQNFFGTPKYMSPEQVVNNNFINFELLDNDSNKLAYKEQIDKIKKSEEYSASLVLYEMITGRSYIDNELILKPVEIVIENQINNPNLKSKSPRVDYLRQALRARGVNSSDVENIVEGFDTITQGDPEQRTISFADLCQTVADALKKVPESKGIFDIGTITTSSSESTGIKPNTKKKFFSN